MRHFNYLTEESVENIFYREPMNFTKESPKDLLALSLGASLYMPGTRAAICSDILTQKHAGLVSMVLDLEDAVSDKEVDHAERNVITQLHQLSDSINLGICKNEDIPLIFIRVRSHVQMKSVAAKLGKAISVLTGFVFPKFTHKNGVDYLDALHEINQNYSIHLYGMPILESPEVIYKESRMTELMSIKKLLDENYNLILNVRMGATDFCGLFGIRRSSDYTIYDISVVRDCIADMVNVFGRSEKEYIVSGPVWEYFYKSERVMKPQLRETPFENILGKEGLAIRKEMINQYLDGLIKEVMMDKNNGLMGKTIIHPTHIKPVHAFSVISYEEYMDAVSILESMESEGGVLKSHFSNKMNEMKPHYNWAKKILNKAKVYGVFHEQNSYIDLLTEQELSYI